jgi:hypothetical protein
VGRGGLSAHGFNVVSRVEIGEPVLALNNVLRGLASLPVRVPQ